MVIPTFGYHIFGCEESFAYPHVPLFTSLHYLWLPHFLGWVILSLPPPSVYFPPYLWLQHFWDWGILSLWLWPPLLFTTLPYLWLQHFWDWEILSLSLPRQLSLLYRGSDPEQSVGSESHWRGHPSLSGSTDSSNTDLQTYEESF